MHIIHYIILFYLYVYIYICLYVCVCIVKLSERFAWYSIVNHRCRITYPTPTTFVGICCATLYVTCWCTNQYTRGLETDGHSRIKSTKIDLSCCLIVCTFRFFVLLNTIRAYQYYSCWLPKRVILLGV